MDVLVIGRNVEVPATVKGDLTARGIAANGTRDPERASIDFDARDFAVVAIGAAWAARIASRLKATSGDRTRRHPA